LGDDFIAAFVSADWVSLVQLISFGFMGGSLTIGGIIAVLAIAVRKRADSSIMRNISSRKFLCCTSSELF
jgi:hypothetical protein